MEERFTFGVQSGSIKLKNIISAYEQYKQDAVASARACVEEGGGIWVGVQQCEGLAALALFNSPETGSTLAITLAAITPDLVRSRIEKSNKEFAYYQARKR